MMGLFTTWYTHILFFSLVNIAIPQHPFGSKTSMERIPRPKRPRRQNNVGILSRLKKILYLFFLCKGIKCLLLEFLVQIINSNTNITRGPFIIDHCIFYNLMVLNDLIPWRRLCTGKHSSYVTHSVVLMPDVTAHDHNYFCNECTWLYWLANCPFHTSRRQLYKISYSTCPAYYCII